MSVRRKIVAIATVGLAAYGLYKWWVAPADLSGFSEDSELNLDDVDAVISSKRRGTRGKGRKINYPEPILQCSLVGEAEALLISANRSNEVLRDCQMRLKAVVKLEGCTINGEYHPSVHFGPSKKLISLKGEPEVFEHLPPVISSQRLNDAIIWSINEAKCGEFVQRYRLTRAGTWVSEWMAHTDPMTITGSIRQFRLRLEWKLRSTLGLNLPLPSQ